MLKCIGENFLILMKFYDSILDEIRGIIIEKIKVNLRSDFCHNNLIACLKYFEFLDFYMKKLYDIEKAISSDREVLLEYFKEESDFEELESLTLENI